MKHVDGHIELSAEEARQGQVLLNTPLRLAVFMGGLGALVVAVMLILGLPAG